MAEVVCHNINRLLLSASLSFCLLVLYLSSPLKYQSKLTILFSTFPPNSHIKTSQETAPSSPPLPPPSAASPAPLTSLNATTGGNAITRPNKVRNIEQYHKLIFVFISLIYVNAYWVISSLFDLVIWVEKEQFGESRRGFGQSTSGYT
ncbi:hypothetical protein PVK06_019192 [Gossypium arboreum]|uniref:Uncharacterized protein n=1 Tax=Gossypium arboreum TaxID=29729 RepID=A0ABR0PJ32_GOSAR|nr:hypothetical protein PVK06_019192 [Gossypium arboreum]